MAKLTEKDIIAWDGPEDDYMNAQHLEFFRNLLTKQQDEIINKADATTDRMQHDTASAADPAARDRERKLLAKIQAAIRAIDEGEYGFCHDTGEPIGLKRLLARPTATLSVEAQERRERLKKQFAD